MARPPVARRTTSHPLACRPAPSTSLNDWAYPSERQAGAQAYRRRVGGDAPRPAASSRAWSTAIFHAPRAGGVISKRQVFMSLLYSRNRPRVLAFASEPLYSNTTGVESLANEPECGDRLQCSTSLNDRRPWFYSPSSSWRPFSYLSS